MALYGIFNHPEERLLDGRRPLRLAHICELLRTQEHAAMHGLQVHKNRGFACACQAADHGYRTHGEALQQAARSLLLNGSENDFKFNLDIPDRPQETLRPAVDNNY